MNLQEELKALKERIVELEELTKEDQEFPQDGDEYWFMSDSGTVGNSFYTNHYSDNYRLETGNFFKTEQDAVFSLEKLKVETELRKFSMPFKEDVENFSIVFYTITGDLNIWYREYCQSQGVIYFESEEKAQQAIKSVGEERIKKYIFGVED